MSRNLFKAFWISKFLPILILVFFLAKPGYTVNIDLRPLADSISVLKNPHKGWYHHYFDNGIWRYMVKKDADLDTFPGLNHIYIRLAWSFFEPQEGQYNWAYIDTLVAHWVPKGYGISLCITSKETRGEGLAVPMGSAGYATPKWVADAGAKGQWITNHSGVAVQNWEPVWDDPIFLAKLSNFHHALAARYDTASWLVDVVTGSLGDWGEGQTFQSSKIVPNVATVKKHLDIYSSSYKHAPLVANDDLLTYGKDTKQQDTLLAYAIANGFSIRDDSPLVTYHFTAYASTYSIQNPKFFDAVWRTRPTTLECEHYQKVVDSGNWIGINGSLKGGSMLTGAIRRTHATYSGYHAYADKWLIENPQLAKDLANLLGYWFFLPQVTLPDTAIAGTLANLSFVWRNHGASVTYSPFQVQIQLVGSNTTWTVIAPTAKPKDWLPDVSITETYSLSLPSTLPQESYSVKVRLFEVIQGDTLPIKLALSKPLLDAKGYYAIGKLPIKSTISSIRPRSIYRNYGPKTISESSTFLDIRGRTFKWTP